MAGAGQIPAPVGMVNQLLMAQAYSCLPRGPAKALRALVTAPAFEQAEGFRREIAMRSVVSFISMLAFGVLAAGALMIGGSGTMPSKAAALPAGDAITLDPASLLIGIMVGVVLGALGRFSWAELPRRVVTWLVANERNFYRFAWASILLAILIFY
jgi:hypothetical protein